MSKNDKNQSNGLQVYTLTAEICHINFSLPFYECKHCVSNFCYILDYR